MVKPKEEAFVREDEKFLHETCLHGSWETAGNSQGPWLREQKGFSWWIVAMKSNLKKSGRDQQTRELFGSLVTHSLTRACSSWNCPSSAESIHASWNISWGESGLIEGYPLRPLLKSNATFRGNECISEKQTCHRRHYQVPARATPFTNTLGGLLA